MADIGSTRSLHMRLADELRSAIVSGELKPDSLHSLNDLAEKLDVSRTSVREALIILAGQGMVQFERSRGVRILQTSTHDIGEVFQLRLLLEVPAARRATTRMTPTLLRDLRTAIQGMRTAVAADDVETLWKHDRQFHWIILSATGNRRLADYVDSLRDLVLRRGTITAGRSRAPEEILAEHTAIMDQMERGNARAAAAAMHEHIRHTAELLITQEAGTASAVRDIDLDWTTL